MHSLINKITTHLNNDHVINETPDLRKAIEHGSLLSALDSFQFYTQRQAIIDEFQKDRNIQKGSLTLFILLVMAGVVYMLMTISIIQGTIFALIAAAVAHAAEQSIPKIDSMTHLDFLKDDELSKVTAICRKSGLANEWKIFATNSHGKLIHADLAIMAALLEAENHEITNAINVDEISKEHHYISI